MINWLTGQDDGDPMSPPGAQPAQNTAAPTPLLKSNNVQSSDVDQWFQTWAGRPATSAEHQKYDGMETSAFMQALRLIPQQGATTTPPPGPQGGPGPGTGNATLGSLLQPVTTQMQTPTPVSFPGGPNGLPIPATPVLNLPRMADIPDLKLDPFTPTTQADVFADPSYDFQRKTGEQGITNSQAAQGMSRTGNSLIDLLKYNQDYAGTAFNNIDTRRRADWTANTGAALSGFGANVSKDEGVFDRNTQAALAEFQPTMEGYSTQAAAGLQTSQNNWDNAFKQWQTQIGLDQFNKTWPYTVLSDQQRIGLQGALS